jgi:hypothetical protein
MMPVGVRLAQCYLVAWVRAGVLEGLNGSQKMPKRINCFGIGAA